MPLQTSMTEDQLAAFMLAELGETASVLDWGMESPQVREVVVDTLYAYADIDAIDEATDIRKLRVLGRREAWRAAIRGLVHMMNTRTPAGASFDFGRLQAQAEVALQLAERDAHEFDQRMLVSSTRVSRVTPYPLTNDDEDEF